MEVVADLAEKFSFGEIRVAHEQNLVLPHVKQTDLYSVWNTLKEHDLATPNLGLISDIIACPGMDYCSLATARSIPLAQDISNRFANLKRQNDIGKLSVNISGCINACGHHHVGDIGLLGVDRRGEEYYQVTLGGSAGENASIGEIIGPAIPYDEVVDAIERVVETYVDLRAKNESFIDAYRRVGKQPFKENLYVTN
jgi:sulfite reductase (NADPH) hemoprotein beta-component